MGKKIHFLALPIILTICFAVVLSGAVAAPLADEPQVDLAIEIKAPDHVAPGEHYVVNLSYSNKTGLASPDDTWVSFLLPDGVQFVSAVDKSGVEFLPVDTSANPLVWKVGSVSILDCWEHIFVTLLVSDTIAETTVLAVSAEIGSSAVESVLENNTASLTSEVCDMAQSRKQAHASEAMPGDALMYTIELRLAQRSGPHAVQQRMVTVIDTLPAAHRVRFLGWVGAEAGTLEGNTLRWQGQVRAGEPLLLQYRLGVEGDVPPGDMITNQARLEWSGGELELDPVTTPVTMTQNAHMFGPAGGSWQFQNGMTLQVPPEAVQAQTRFQYQLLFQNETPVGPAGYMFAHKAFEMNAFQFGEIHQFQKQLAFEFKLQPEDIAGMKKETLRLWYRSGPGEPWTMGGEPNWLSEDTVLFETDHFTQFALFAEANYRIHLAVIRR